MFIFIFVYSDEGISVEEQALLEEGLKKFETECSLRKKRAIKFGGVYVQPNLESYVPWSMLKRLSSNPKVILSAYVFNPPTFVISFEMYLFNLKKSFVLFNILNIILKCTNLLFSNISFPRTRCYSQSCVWKSNLFSESTSNS